MLSKFLSFLKELPNKVMVGIIVSVIVSGATGLFVLFAKNPAGNIQWLFTTILSISSPTISLTTLILFFYILYRINALKKTVSSLENSIDRKSPEFEFANRITLRKIYNGPDSSQFSNNPATSYALSVRVGIKNHEDVRVFNTQMSLCLVRYGEMKDREREGAKTDEKRNILYERHGIEEFKSQADYIRIIHRFSFPINDLSYLTVRPVIKCKGKTDYDRIEILFSGFYGSNEDVLFGDQIKPFFVSKKYNFTDIRFANRTEKVTTYTSLNGELYPKVEWSNFKQEPYQLSSLDEKNFEEELEKILMQKNSGRNCLIIGGGISGLVAATHLQSQGFKVKVIAFVTT